MPDSIRREPNVSIYMLGVVRYGEPMAKVVGRFVIGVHLNRASFTYMSKERKDMHRRSDELATKEDEEWQPFLVPCTIGSGSE